MKKVALLFCLVVTMIGAAFAQTPGRGSGELSFGYQHLTGDIGKDGWGLGAEYNFGKNWGLEGELGGYYGKKHDVTDHVHTFLFGPRIVFDTNSYKWTPFAHFLIGPAYRSGSGANDTAFSWALGGGVDWNVSDRWAVPLKADLLHTNFFGNGDTHARVGIGVAYKFGK